MEQVKSPFLQRGPDTLRTQPVRLFSFANREGFGPLCPPMCSQWAPFGFGRSPSRTVSGSHSLSPHGARLETHSHRARPCGFCHLGWAEGLSDGWKFFCLKRDYSKPSKLNTSCTRTFRVVSTRVPVIVSLVTASSWMTWATGDERTHSCAHRQGQPPHVTPASCLVAQRGCSSCLHAHVPVEAGYLHGSQDRVESCGRT